MAGQLPTEFDDSRPFDVVGFGENSVDHLCAVPHYPRPDEKLELSRYELQGGGQIATAMVCCARLGLKASYIGAVGNDELGRIAREGIAAEGVHVDAVQVVAGASSRVAFIVVDEAQGTRTILHQLDPRLALPASAYGDALLAGRVLELDTTVPETALEAAKKARAAGVVVVLDIDRVYPGAWPLLEAVDVVIGSSGFTLAATGHADPGEALLALSKRTPAFVCCTLGDQGSLAIIDGKPHREPAFRVRVLDTTGAGDIYHGAFIYGMLRRWPASEVMRFANAAAGLKCRKLGGRPGIPSAAEVAALLLRSPG